MIEALFVRLFFATAVLLGIFFLLICAMYRKHLRALERDYEEPTCALQILEGCRVLGQAVKTGITRCRNKIKPLTPAEEKVP